MNTSTDRSVRSLAKAVLLAAVCAVTPLQAMAITAQMNESMPANPVDQAWIVGPVDQPMLIVPMELPAWAAQLGITEAERVYKGLCGPSGAAISVEDLYRTAELDLNRLGQQRGPGITTELVGSSPGFEMSYDIFDPILVGLYLPALRRAIEYVDGSFDNRVQVNASIALGVFTGGTIGTASSARYTIPWSVYVEGLRTQAVREDNRFANELPDSVINMLYDGSSSSSSETSILVTDAQLRAIFGDNVIPRATGVSITFNSASNWAFFGCDTDPSGGQSSLIDVAVHELTHSMGFTSGIAEGGNNSNNIIQGLDVARFRAFNLPGTNAAFGINPRVGEDFTGELHFYSSFPTGSLTLVEAGDGHQPSHLNYFDDPDDKLGVMDPVIVDGTTLCPEFYTAADLLPLDDMGWKPVRGFNLQDCNSNGLFDAIDIAIGTSLDVDGDLRPDECETFRSAVANPLDANGLVRTVYEVPGLTDLTFFNPTGPGTTAVESQIVSALDETVNFGSVATRVIDYEGFIFVPSRDEYAFRVEHPNGMNLLVSDLVIGQSDRSGSLTRTGSLTNISSQSFIQLDAGWHPIFVQFLSTGSSATVKLVRESRGLGGWADIGFGDLQVADSFEDCDGNGTNDFLDRINDLSIVIDLGVAGQSDTPIQFDTLGSSFDTEIALWDSSGNLLQTNDDVDGGPIRQSSLMATLSSGQYIFAITGYNTGFISGPEYFFINGCSESGSYIFNIDGTEEVSGTIPSGRAHLFVFTIEELSDCDGDGTPDSAELDCDGNGIPDDCEIPTVADTESVGVVGTNDMPFLFSTCGSSYDTEIAIWGSDGTLLAQDDDFCGLQSEISMTLPAGSYYAAISGYDIVFSEDFGMRINADGVCSEGGLLEVVFGDLQDSVGVNPGRIVFVEFEIAEPKGCGNPADLNGDGALDFFDISFFLSNLVDYNTDGNFDFFDISSFLQDFGMGCL